MTKLIVQVPCLNEAGQLPDLVRHLPRQVDGFDQVEWLVIDDGSTDGTVEVARSVGFDHIVRLPVHKGLAIAFQTGLDAALKLGADVIVNTDADGQYDGSDISRLVKPILQGEADMAVGDRGVASAEGFNWTKRRLQTLGSWVVSRASGTRVPDATSGFRAYNRDAALQLVVVTAFTYTLETLIQAGATSVTVANVPIERHHVERPSRLFTSNWDYIKKSIGGISRIYAFYRPLRVFTSASAVLAVAGLAAWSPFLISWAEGDPHGHIQSIILGAVLIIAAVQIFALGIVADLLGKQRVLSQFTLERVRRLEVHTGTPPSHYEPGDPASVRDPAPPDSGPPTS
ncbi:MAG TPA: glycosyltransferase family 2 protein [Acidimicrobiales bacterium]|nr:glycosyltransferase family 2 protein [Acidimicrobiales bacterium]